MRFVILATVLTVVIGIDPRCLRQTPNGLALHFQHPTNCKKFYKCNANNELVEEECENVLEYNPQLEICDWPRGFCTLQTMKPVSEVMSCVGLPDGIYYPNYSDQCKSFYYCSKGESRIGYCYEGSQFDSKLGKCIHNKTIECEPPKKIKLINYRVRNNNNNNEVNIDCKSLDNTTLIANLEDGCKSYYQCINGESKRVYCEGSLLFDTHRKVCDWPQLVNCDNKNFKIISHKKVDIPLMDCENQPNEYVIGANYNTECNSFFVCHNNIAVEDYCGDGLRFNQELGVCDFIDNVQHCDNKLQNFDNTNRIICENKHGDIFNHPKDCSSYFECYLGHTIIKRCNNGERFDTIERKCIEDSEHVCEKSSKISQPLNTLTEVLSITLNMTESSETFYPNYAYGCKSYFACKNGQCNEIFCPVGQSFNTKKSSCENSENVFCNSPIQVRSSVRADCGAIPDGSFMPDPRDNTKYYMCLDGTIVHQSCGDGQIFNEVLLICVPDDGTGKPSERCDGLPHGTYRPDHINCNQFYLCIDNIWVHDTCRPGQMFDSVHLYCKINDGTCKENALGCDGLPHGTYRPDHLNCNQFYLCVDNAWVHDTCRPGQMFDSVNLYCKINDGTCKEKALGCDGLPHGTYRPDHLNCNQFYLCVDNVWVHDTCRPGQMFDSVNLYCKINDGTCKEKALGCDGLPHGTYRPDHLNCNQFYLCVDNVWVHDTCRPGQMFDSVNLYCKINDGTCKEKTIGCDGLPHGTFRPDYQNCDKFYLCVIDRWVQQCCNEGQMFDPVNLYCIADDGSCHCTEPVSGCDGLPHGTIRPDYQNCDKFYVCVIDTWMQQCCNEGQMFDPVKLHCVPEDGSCHCTTGCDGLPHGTFRPDYQNCDKFYICVVDTWIHQTCREGQMFDPVNLYCVPDDGSCHCPTPIPGCDGHPSGTVRPDYENCDKFYVCVIDTWLQQCCNEGQMFDPVRLHCVPDDGSCHCTTPIPGCDGHPSGTFRPDYENCDKFYICIIDRWMHQSCSEGQMFDPVKLYCVPDDGSCHCPPPITGCDGFPHGTFRPDYQNCDKFYLCVIDTWIQQCCSEGQMFDPVNLCCVPDDGSCHCTTPIPGCDGHPSGTFRPDYENCDKFYICVIDRWMHQSCSEGQMFDPVKLYCVPDDGSCHCPPPISGCDGFPHGTFRPDYQNCDKFYLCVIDTWIQQCCSEGQMFDPVNLCCVPDDGSCHCTTPIPGCDGHPSGTFRPDYENCDKFYICVIDRWMHQSCSEGQMFDPVKLYCVPDDGSCHCPPPITGCDGFPHGTFRPDYQNCDKFYLCVIDTWIQQCCSEGQMFDPVNLCCVPDDGSCHCTTPIPGCDGHPSGTFRPDYENCDKFYICVIDRWMHQSCSEGQMFDPVKLYCVPDDGSCHCPPPITGCDGHPSGTVRPDYENCDKFYVCVIDTWLQQCCNEGQMFDPVRLHCVPDDGSCHCTTPIPGCDGFPHGTFRPDYENCDQFYICVIDTWMHQCCSDGQMFDPVNLYCVPDDGSCHCTTPIPGCDGHPSGTVRPDYENCDKFYVCVIDTWLQQCCNEGQMFDPVKLHCVPDDGSCHCTTPIPGCDGFPHGTFRPDYENCDQFYICVIDTWMHQSCSDGQMFDPVNLYCVPDDGSCHCTTPIPGCDGHPSGTVRPDYENCDKFYVCVIDTWLQQCCNEGQMFDPVRLHCVPDDGSCHCTTPIPGCDGFPHGTFRPDYENCDQFYICVIDTWLHQSCSDGQMFDPVNLYCVPDDGSCHCTTPIPGCDGHPSGTVRPDYENCDKFYVCVIDTWLQQCCNEGQMFDPVKLHCVPDDGSCHCTTPIPGCDGFPHGTFRPDYENCDQFYICVIDTWLHQSCSDGQMFDPVNLYCVPDDGSCHCTTPIPGCDGHPSGTVRPDYENCDKFYVCVIDTWLQQCCNEGQMFDPVRLHCVPDDGSCHCTTPIPGCDGFPHGTFRPDYENCDQFYICVIDTWMHQCCSDGQMFDPVNLYCVPDDGSCHCTTPVPGCDGLPHGTLRPDYQNCDQFYICIVNTWEHECCNEGEMFDPVKLRCVPDDGSCHCTTPVAGCDGHPHGTFRPDYENCDKFYLCVIDTWIQQCCNEGQMFDPVNLCCVPDDGTCNCLPTCTGECYGTYMPDPKDCTKFYICLGSYSIHQQCPAGQYFDSVERYCKTEDGKCNTSPVPVDCYGQHGAFLPYKKDCSKFYICINGHPVLQQCNPGQYYDESLGYCQKDHHGICPSSSSHKRADTPIDCSGIPDGAYVEDTNDCSRYYICSNGFSIPQQCPKYQYFDSLHLYCRPNNGNCPTVSNYEVTAEKSNNKISDLCTGQHGVIFADEFNCDRFYACVYGKVVHEQCYKDQYFNKKIGECVNNNGECNNNMSANSTHTICEGKIDFAYIPDQNDETRFFICIDNIPVPEKCEPDEIFDAILGYCREINANDTNKCKGKHGVIIKDDLDCMKYQVCFNSLPIEKECLSGEYFNDELKECTIDTDNKCHRSRNVFKSDDHPDCIGRTELVFYPNYKDGCRSFYTCVNGKPQIESCPDNFLYNPLLKKCDLPEFVTCMKDDTISTSDPLCIGAVEGVRYPNIENGCKSFYVCLNGNAQQTFCDANFLYNSALGTCDWSNNVICSTSPDMTERRSKTFLRKFTNRR